MAPMLGAVALTVSDLSRSVAFYQQVIGLHPLRRDETEADLAAGDGRALVRLVQDPAAPMPQPGASGLYHLALLVPTRSGLAAALGRLAGAGWKLTGAADHLVSEALYLQDNEGNGIEIYRDRPRDGWQHADNGDLKMATLPLDLADLARQAPGDGGSIEPGTSLGHVHLHVADLHAAEQFYTEHLGLEVTVRGYPGALFLAWNGYHHHLGLNTWSGAAGPPPPGALGLRWFEVADERPTGELADPSGNRIHLQGS